MKSPIDNIIYKEIRNPLEPPNILYMGYNGLFEWTVSNITNAKFYIDTKTVQNWQGDLPPNFIKLPYGYEKLANRIDIYAVVCNQRNLIKQAIKIADLYHVPCYFINHELPSKDFGANTIRYLNSLLPKQWFSHEVHPIISKAWCLDHSRIIPYAIPDIAEEIKRNKLAVWQNINIAKEAMNIFSTIEQTAITFNPNVDYQTTINNLNQSEVSVMFFTDFESPILVLLAMAARSVVITNRTVWTEQIINHGENGFLFNSVKDGKHLLRKLPYNNLDHIRQNALDTITNHFNLEAGREAWYNSIEKKRIYIR